MPDYQTRYAAGAGIQVTLVVVKFEAGYLRTLRRLNGDPKGAWMARMTFVNIF
jgi:hypothetical protein